MAIFTSIATAIGSALGFGAASFFVTATAFALKAVAGLGLSLLAQSLAGKPKDPTFSINGTLQGGGDVPRSFIMGRTATAGSLVFVNTWGQDGDTPNAYLTQVIALSDLPVRGLAEVWVNGELVTLGGLTDRGYAVNEYPDSLWVKFYDGTQTTADSFLFTSVSNGNRWWNPDRIGRGVAYAIVTARVSKNMFSGVPSFKFVLEGMRLYDISRDSTQGGVGPQRYADPATWGGDGDFLPAVQIYNLLRGITYNGQWFYGLQNLSASRLPAIAWITQIEKHRAGTLESTGWVNTYRSGGEIQVEAPLTSAIEALLTACQGRISEVGGVYYLHSGAPDAPVIAFTDDDILSTEEQEFTPFLGLADTINGVSANYPSPADGWVAKTAPPLYRTDLEAIDGNRRLMADVDLNFVPYPEQVQRLMKSALEEARRFRRHTIVLPPKFWAYATPGTVFSWTSERNGYIAKLMRIDGVADRANLDVMIDITEVDPADYDWSSDTEFKPPVDGQLGVIRPTPQPIVDWFAEPATVKDSSGEDRRPAIRLTWDNGDGRLDDVIGIEYEVRLQATLEKISEGRTDQPQVGSMLISQSLLPNEDYVVRGRYIPGGDRPVLWSGFIPVTTPNILLSDKDVFVDVDLTGIEEALGWLRNSTRTAQDAIDGLIAAQMELATVAYKDTRSAVYELSVELGAARASFTQDLQLAVSETQAVAGRVETLTAALGGNTASINIAWAAVAAPSGYAARYGITAAVNDENYRSASFLMDVPSNPSSPTRIIMKAGQVVMVSDDDATIKRPFVFQSGVLYLDEVRVNQLSALSGVLGNVDISSAYIGTLTVGTSNIEPGAITAAAADTLAGSGSVDITLVHGPGSPRVKVEALGKVFTGTSTDSAYVQFVLRNVTDSADIDTFLVYSKTTPAAGAAKITGTTTYIFNPPSGRTQTVFRLTATPFGATPTGSTIVAEASKR
ncbi:phage tail protein [Agrobacterium tumefaciens]|uniref:phage tail protein n=1 Tax=Agrobacterium tumefaciens TaxID=358 RepID=UPI000B3F726F|nr:phage tail protein [Agrobacterium tumefaciens]NSY01156.1 phage tail protein [Agrobacterium tumefaciens]OVE92222.1 phage tail protein [Agrobacterium tumefaciens]